MTMMDPKVAGWAGDLVLRAEARFKPGKADRFAVETGLFEQGGRLLCPQLLTLAESLGDTKISSIVQTIRTPRSRYSKVTPKQRFAVANALLTKYGTARTVYAASLGISEDELLSAGHAWAD